MIVGQKIKKLRLEKNITQETLANHLGVTPQAVSKWEQEAALPDISLLIPLADFFDISVDSLLREKPKSKEFDLSCLEITKVRKLVGECGCRIEYSFKNVSPIYIRSLKIKFIFKNDNGELIDYHSDYLFNLDPGFTRRAYAHTRATKNPNIDIEIEDYTIDLLKERGENYERNN